MHLLLMVSILLPLVSFRESFNKETAPLISFIYEISNLYMLSCLVSKTYYDRNERFQGRNLVVCFVRKDSSAPFMIVVLISLQDNTLSSHWTGIREPTS
jgi:hypothetical protein